MAIRKGFDLRKRVREGSSEEITVMLDQKDEKASGEAGYGKVFSKQSKGHHGPSPVEGGHMAGRRPEWLEWRNWERARARPFEVLGGQEPYLYPKSTGEPGKYLEL